MNRTRVLLIALALSIPVLVAGCGGGDDPEELIERAFDNENSIDSGVIDLSVDVSVEGEQGGSLTANVTGPFASDPEAEGTMGQADLDITASGDGAVGVDDFQAGLTITEDNLFVEFDGTDYELGEEQFAQLEEQSAAQAEAAEDEDPAGAFSEGCAQAIEAQGGDPAACDFDVTEWFSELSNEGTEDLGGAEVTHVAGQLDVAAMLSDLLGIATAVPGATGDVPPDLIEGQLDGVSEAITEASFDVYPATEDDTLRGLGFTLAVDPSQVAGGELVPIDSAGIDFSLEISDVGAEQTFEAPADAQPIEELLGQFQGGVPGLTPGAGGFEPGGAGVPGGEDSAPGAPGGAAVDPAVQDCIAEAADAAAITECLEQFEP